MTHLPSPEANPGGLHQRYRIEKTNGEPVDPRAVYIVLRIDGFGDDPIHTTASRCAAEAYAFMTAGTHLDQVATELRKTVETLKAQDPPRITPPRTGDPMIDQANGLEPEGSTLTPEQLKGFLAANPVDSPHPTYRRGDVVVHKMGGAECAVVESAMTDRGWRIRLVNGGDWVDACHYALVEPAEAGVGRNRIIKEQAQQLAELRGRHDKLMELCNDYIAVATAAFLAAPGELRANVRTKGIGQEGDQFDLRASLVATMKAVAKKLDDANAELRNSTAPVASFVAGLPDAVRVISSCVGRCGYGEALVESLEAILAFASKEPAVAKANCEEPGYVSGQLVQLLSQAGAPAMTYAIGLAILLDRDAQGRAIELFTQNLINEAVEYANHGFAHRYARTFDAIAFIKLAAERARRRIDQIKSQPQPPAATKPPEATT